MLNKPISRRCGCGEGDSGCRECGICRQCAEGFVTAARPEPAEAMESGDGMEEEDQEPVRDDTKGGKIVPQDKMVMVVVRVSYARNALWG